MILNDKYSKREANFELLRIISMFMVLVLHFLSKCGFLSLDSGNLFIDNIPWIFEGICYVAVDCFVMLTGYFMYKSKLKISKIITLIIQVLFYSVVTYLIEIIFLNKPIDLRELLIAFTPVISGKYWFISNYIVLLFISPFLNSLIEKMNKKIHLILCSVLLIIFSFLSTFFSYSIALKFEKNYDIVWFIVLYFVSSFIGKYGFNISKKKSIIIYLISTFCIFASKIFFEVTESFSPVKIIKDLFLENNEFSYNYSSVFVFLSAVFLLFIFKDIKIKNKNVKTVINFTGSLVLTCYLLPDEKWWNFVNPNNYTDSIIGIVGLSILSLIGIFIFCCIIELIRKTIFNFIYKKTEFEKICERLQNSISEKFNKLTDRI